MSMISGINYIMFKSQLKELLHVMNLNPTLPSLGIKHHHNLFLDPNVVTATFSASREKPLTIVYPTLELLCVIF